jgi:hypothetical protein
MTTPGRTKDVRRGEVTLCLRSLFRVVAWRGARRAWGR